MSHRNKFGSSLLTIFEGKIAQFCALVKSTIFLIGISNFGIVYLKRYIFKLYWKNFRFMGTLRGTETVFLTLKGTSNPILFMWESPWEFWYTQLTLRKSAII